MSTAATEHGCGRSSPDSRGPWHMRHAGISRHTHGYMNVETDTWRHKSRHSFAEKQTQHTGARSIPQAQARGPSPIPPAQPAWPPAQFSAPLDPALGSLQSSLLAHPWSMPPTNTGVNTQRPCIQTHDTSFTFGIMVGWKQHPQHLRPKDPLSLGLSLPWAQALDHEAEGEAGP